MTAKKTKWIVVTGLDGSGKTSLVSNLTSWLVEEKQLKVKRDRFGNLTLLNKQN